MLILDRLLAAAAAILAAAACVSAAPSTLPTTAPVTLASRRPAAPKQLYFSTGYDASRWAIPPGYLPAVTDAGGRFLDDRGREDSFWVGGYFGPNEHIDHAKARLVTRPLPPGTLYVIDQEQRSWSTDVRLVGPAVAEYNRRRFRAQVRAMREGNDLIDIAIYGVLPHPDYWTITRQWQADEGVRKAASGQPLTAMDHWSIAHAYAVRDGRYALDDSIGGREGRAAYLRWRDANTADTQGRFDNGRVNRSAGLEDAVDAITPSIYDFYAGDDTEGYVRKTIEEARRVSNGRRIYPFVWPRYHDGNPALHRTAYPIEEWRAHVRLILRLADGVVLWGCDPVRDRAYVDVLREEASRATR